MGKTRIGSMVLAVVLLVGLLAGCGGKDEVIKVGSDEVPSLYSVVGERKVTGSSTGISDGITYSEKTYSSGVVTLEDVQNYYTFLEDAGFAHLIDSELQGTRMDLQMGKESVDAGKIVLVEIAFDSAGTTVITYKVGQGTLTFY